MTITKSLCLRPVPPVKHKESHLLTESTQLSEAFNWDRSIEKVIIHPLYLAQWENLPHISSPLAQNEDLISKGAKCTLQFSPQLNSSSRFVSLLALLEIVEIKPGWVCGVVSSVTGRSNPRPASGSNQAGPSVPHRHLDSILILCLNFYLKEKSKVLFFEFTDNKNWMWKMHRFRSLDSVLE